MRRTAGRILFSLGVAAIGFIAGRTWSAKPMLPAMPYIEPDERFERRANLDLRDVPFGELIERLSKAYGVKLTINWPAFKPVEVTAKTPMGVYGRGVALEHVFPSEATPGYLTIAIRNGELVVTTMEDAAADVVTRRYDVNGLHRAIYGADLPEPDIGEAQDWVLTPALPPTPIRRIPIAHSYEQFIDFVNASIRAGVAPGSWKDEGGQLGSLSELHGVLYVTTFPRYHLKVARYLDWLATRKPGDENLQPNAFTGFDP
jgi:hypothetical protein